MVKIADFGLVDILNPKDGTLTTVCGTPGFIAPEVLCEVEGYDTRSDIFSIGCLLHYLLTNTLIVHGKNF